MSKKLAVLSETLLQHGTAIRFRAPGTSMTPAIHDGEWIVVQPVTPGDIKIGDIVLYRINSRLVAHRIHRLPRHADEAFILRGDTNGEDEYVSEDRILGKVVRAESDVRSVRVSGSRARLMYFLRKQLRSTKHGLRNQGRRAVEVLGDLTGSIADALGLVKSAK